VRRRKVRKERRDKGERRIEYEEGQGGYERKGELGIGDSTAEGRYALASVQRHHPV
jgi:hypothetical protein